MHKVWLILTMAALADDGHQFRVHSQSGGIKAVADGAQAESGAEQTVTVRVRGGADSVLKVESNDGAFGVRAGDVPFGAPRQFLDGKARVERVPVERKLSDAGWSDGNPVLAHGRDGRRWAAWISTQDRTNVVAVSDGDALRRVTEPGDHRDPAIAVDGRGWLHVVWAEREGGEYHLYQTVYLAERWSRASRITQPGTSNLAPVLATDGGGRMALVWQSLRDGRAAVLLRLWDGRGWGAEQTVSVGGGNAWSPAASWGGGKLWVAWDAYRTGGYHVWARSYEAAAAAAPVPGMVTQVSAPGRFAMRPSLAVTAAGVPVAAWEESDTLLARDYPFLADRDAAIVSDSRRVRVASLGGGEWIELAHPELSLAADLRRSAHSPQLTLDTSGRLFLAFGVLASVSAGRTDFRAAVERWDAYVTQLEGTAWRPAVPMPSTAGRYTMRAAISAAGGQVHVAWPSGRDGEVDVFTAAIPATGAPAAVHRLTQ